MTLQDIFDQLAFGELRNIFNGGSDIDAGPQALNASQRQQVLPSIQLGLTEIYKQFHLREGILSVPLVADQATYILAPEDDDLLKVERIFGVYQEEEVELILNERQRKDAIYTTSRNTLMVPTNSEDAPWLTETTTLDVRYRANHPKIDVAFANAAPTLTLLDLPHTHMEPLLLYIASRVYNPIGMTPGAMHEGNNYFQRYLASIQLLKDQNYEIDDDYEDEKLYQRGFC